MRFTSAGGERGNRRRIDLVVGRRRCLLRLGKKRLVAETIQRNIRTSDLVARLGGDEFAILLPEKGRESARMVSRKIQKFLMDSMQEHKWVLTFSMGVVTITGSASLTVDEMIRMADNLMYSAKEEGKNRIKHGIVDA